MSNVLIITIYSNVRRSANRISWRPPRNMRAKACSIYVICLFQQLKFYFIYKNSTFVLLEPTLNTMKLMHPRYHIKNKRWKRNF